MVHPPALTVYAGGAPVEDDKMSMRSGKFLLLALLAVCQGNVIKNSEPFEECSECPLDKHYLLPHEYDCTKFYYCEYGVRWTTPRDCAPGTEFSFELQVCIHPSIANCGLPGPSTTTSSSTTTSTTPSTTTTTEDPCETEAPCDEDGRLPNGCPVCPDVHLLLPAEDCGQFYYCAHGDKVITDCPAGLHFNPVLQVCDWPQVAGCEPTSPPCTPESGSNCGESTTTTTTSTTSSTTTSTSTTPSTTTTTEEPCETEAPCDEDARLPNGCPVCPDVHLLLPAEDCGQFYYCAHGDKVITDCPAGLHFNPVLQVCDWPQVAGCEPTIPPCTPESGSNCGESTTTTTTGTTPSTTTTTSTTTEEPCETDPPCDEDARLPNGCPVCPDVHLLLPAEDCGQFYYCAHGDKVITDCPAGLHFNPVLQVCDWPQVAGCEPTSPPCTPESDNNCGESTTTTTTTSTTPSTTTSTSTTPSTTTTTSTTPSTTTTTEEPCETEAPCDEDGRLPNGCPVCPDVHLLLPAEDCGQFYYCVHGDKVITDCPAGLHFNPVLQVCDWPQVAGCEPTSPPCTPESGNNCGENTTTTTTTSTTPSTTTTTSTTPSTTTTTEEPCETDPPCDEDAKLPNGCPVCPDVHLLLPAEDCGQFYYCVHGDKVITDCPAGLHFNPVLQVCDWPQVAGCEPTSPPCTPESGGNCGESTTTTTTTTTPSTTTTASTTTTSSTTPSTTTTTSTTPSTTTTTSTTPSTTTTTEEPCETEAPCDEDGRLPNGCPVCPDVHLLLPAEDCGQFYYCVHGDKVITDCPAGLHFNPVLQVCDWPQVAGCEPTSPPCTPESGGNCGEDSTTTTTTSTTPSTTTTTSTTPSTTPSTTTTTEEPCETEAPCDEDGRLPNGCPVCPDVHLLLPAEDCSQFYYCVHGDKVITDCPAGLHFNPVLQVCDWPQVAGCEPTIPPCTPESGGNCGENTTTTTTTSTTPSTTTTTSTTPSTTTTTEEPCETEAPCDEDGRLPNGCPVCPDLHLLLPAEDCGQFYYCVHGDKVITDCPAGLHFNPVLQVCDWPQVAGCEPTIPPCTPESGGNCGENTTSTTPSTTTITSTTPSTTTTTEEPCETEAPCDEDARLPNGCPVCPDVHLLLPAEDCSQFYYCAHGDKVITDCPAGLHFNPVLQVCDWPQVAGCEPTIPPCTPESGSNCGENTTTTTTTSTTPSTTTTTSTTPSTTTTTEEPCETEAPCDEDGRLPNGCPVCPDLHLLLPAEDCGQFYYCVHGDKVITDCPAGLHFNPVLQVCDWPQVAGCEPTIPPCTPESGGNCGENTTTTTTTSTTPSTTTTTSTTPSTTTTTEEPCETEAPCDEDGRLPNGCPVCPDVHLLLPAEDCGQFYYCAHGDKVITDCPAGLHFNPVLQVCDWPQVAGCEPTSPPCTPESGSNCGESTTTTTTSTTPSTTTTTSTTPSTTTTTEDPCETEAPCDENARLPNGCPVCPDVDLLLPAENCGQFYYCVHGDKVITDCPAGLHFSSALQVCDWPQTAGCEPTRPPCTTTTTSGNCV